MDLSATGHQRTVGHEALPGFVRACQADDAFESLLRLLDEAMARAPGHRLLTVLVYFADKREAQRVYSSRPVEYPVGGRKTLSQAPRMQQVLTTGLAYISRTRQEIIDNFPDHPKLLAMGCESIVNMPVRWGSTVLGTVNLMHREGHYHANDLPRIEAWSQLVVPAFMAITFAPQNQG